jgi:hypothetical protein
MFHDFGPIGRLQSKARRKPGFLLGARAARAVARGELSLLG